METLTRRDFIKTAAVLTTLNTASGSAGPAVQKERRIVVIGAGAFGGWSALHLLRAGAKVTLIDAWGPGNSRASSGGETRVIRATYGDRRIYTQMALRALQLWRENEERWHRKLYTRTGGIWMVIASEEFESASIPLLKEAGLPHEKLMTADAAKRYPQINFDGVRWVLSEPEVGFLLARQACAAVLEGFLEEGGEYRQAHVQPGEIGNGAMSELKLSNGESITADTFVFACGPWLGKIFPDVLGSTIQPTRQEVYFFGTPAGDTRFDEKHLPVWILHDTRLFYGIPGNQWRGFKIGDDTHGPAIDPTSAERSITPESLKAARDILEFRFPAMKGAPLLEARVCQYENSPDSHFIVDRHPVASNVWLVGGGSGHGYKHGPAFGELVSGIVLEKRDPEPTFQLARFSK